MKNSIRTILLILPVIILVGWFVAGRPDLTSAKKVGREKQVMATNERVAPDAPNSNARRPAPPVEPSSSSGPVTPLPSATAQFASMPVSAPEAEEENPLWKQVLEKAAKARIPRHPEVVKGLPDIQVLAAGQVVRFPLPGGMSVGGTVKLAHDDEAVRRVGGALDDGAGSFSFAVVRPGLVEGQILLEKKHTAVLYRQLNGKTEAIETDLGNVVCDPQAMAAALPTTTVGTAPASTVAAIVPTLSSRPTATSVLYLDFDGATVTDANWNSGGTINAANSGLTDAQITEVWNRVKEDFMPFNIDVTTDAGRYSGAAAGRRMRCIITTSDAWYNTPAKVAAGQIAGGVANLWSFDRSGTTASSTIPCWVFSNRLGSSAKNVAEASSHELGHTLGLYHDGTSTLGYYTGHGSGATGWAPIMGVGYYQPLVQWSKGEYSGANNTEDDLAIISGSTNGFGYLADDAGNSRGAAAALSVSGSSVNTRGMISNSADVDYYSVTVNAGNLNLSINPSDISPNLDILATLENSSGTVIATNNPDASLPASLSASVTSGTYYIKIQGTGKGTGSTGYTSYGSMGPYTITGSLPAASPEIAVEQPVGNNLTDNSGSVAFGSVTTGSSTSLTFTIKNLGLANLTGLSITKAGTYPNDFTVSGPSVSTLGASTSTTFTVTFSPGAIGARTAILRVASNDADENPFDINVSGTGVGSTYPEIAVEQPVGTGLSDNVSIIGYGSQTVGVASTPKIFTIRNVGTTTLSGLALSKTGTNTADFALGSLGSTSLAPGSSTSFSVTFTPAATGARSAVVRVASNDADENPFDLNLSGTGVLVEPADIAVSQGGVNLADGGSVAFGSMDVGGTSVVRTFTVSNPGKQDLTGMTISLVGTNLADFTVTPTSLPNLAPNGTTSFTVSFRAGGAGARATALRIASNDPDENPFDINLSGTGMNGEGRSIGPDAYGYTATNVTTHTFTDISTSGTVVLDGLDDAAITVPVGFGFPFYGTTYTQVHVNTNGLVTFNAQTTTYSNFDLSAGSLGQPAIAVWWDDFVTTAGAADKVYYQTTGSVGNRVFRVQWNVTDISAGSGGTPYRFNLEFFEASGQIRCNYANTSRGTVRDSGAQGTVGIQDTNGNSANRYLNWSTDSLSLSDGMTILYMPPSAPAEIAVSEQGGASLTDNASTVSFGGTTVGSSITKTFVISNLGSSNLTGLALTKSGTASANYTLGSLGTTTLPPGGTTTFIVNFTPSATGTRTAAIQIASNDGDENPFDINVTGSGGDSTVDAGFNPTVSGGTVVSMAMQADGKILVGGTFTSINGVAKSRIARFNADLTLDSSFSCSADAEVVAIAVQPDGKIVLGGLFTTINGTSRPGLARISADGSLDTSITQNADSFVYALALQPDGKILVGGGFNDIGGVARNCIARLNANGTLDTGFTATTGNTVDTIEVQPDGKILIGGIFDTVNSVTRNKAARLYADGSLDTSFTANANDWVQAIALQTDGNVLLGGSFSTVNGITRRSGARVSSTGVVDANFNPDFSSWVYSIGVQANGASIWAGWFATAQSVNRGGLARFNPDGSMDGYPNTWLSGAIRSCVLQANGHMMLGGAFTTAGGLSRTGLARVMNNTAASQELSASYNSLTWLRSGSTPEVSQVTFLLSTNGGSTWTSLGTPSRVIGGWSLSGLSLPSSGMVRATALADGGNFNGCESVVMQTLTYNTTPDILVRQGTGTSDPVITDGQSTPISFGSTQQDTPTSRTFRIENTGTGLLTLSTPTKTGTNPGDFTVSSPLSTSLAPGAATTFTVTFAPTAVGTRTAIIALPSNDPDEAPFDFNVTGTSTVPIRPDIAVEQPSGTNLTDGVSTVAYGTVAIGSNAARAFVVRNQGTADLTISSIVSNLSDFAVGSLSDNVLSPGEAITFNVTFSPTAAGARTANLQVNSNDPDEAPFDVALTGTGQISTTRSLGPDAYGYTATNNVSYAFNDISSTGTAILDSVDDATTSVSLPFTFVFYGTGQTTAHISSNGLVSFGSATASFSNWDLSNSNMGLPFIAAMWDDWVTSQTSLDRVYYTVTGSAGSRVFTVQWNVSPISESGLAEMIFQVQMFEGSNQIRMNYQRVRVGSSKDDGASATIGIQDMNGASVGRYLQWGYNVTSITGGMSILLSPPGPPADIAVASPSGNLADGGSHNVGNAALAATLNQTFTISNTGSSPLSGLSITKDGTHSAEYTVTQPIATVLAPGASTTFTVAFSPAAAGTRTAALHIASNDPDESPFDINLSGTGAALPKIQIQDNATGATLVDNSGTIIMDASSVGASTQRTFTIRNTGLGTLTGLALAKSGTHAADFTLGSLSTTSLDPNTATTFTVTFAPSAIGTRSVGIQVSSNDADASPFEIAITGQGSQLFTRSSTTATGRTWNRPVANGSLAPVSLSGSATAVRFQAMEFTVSTPGSYTFRSVATSSAYDNYLFLYAGTFNHLTPLTNVRLGNDDNPNVGQSGFTLNLTTGVTYNLITTGYSNGDAGNFTNTIDGPGTVNATAAAPEMAIQVAESTLAADSSLINFGTLSVGGATSVTFVMRNIGDQMLSNISSSIVGENSADFSTPALSGISLSGGASLPVTVTFTPIGTGVRYATLRFTSNDPDTPTFDVQLRGDVASPPVITTPPQSTIVALGTPFQLTPSVVGSNPMTITWLKNNTAIAGTANALNYGVTQAALTHAAAYQVRAVNSFGTVTSTAAQVAVVDTTPSTSILNAGTIGTFTASAAGNGLTYAWYRDNLPVVDDSRISGSATRTLTLRNLSSADDGVYVCRITAPGGTLDSGEKTLAVYALPPEIVQPVTMPDAYVSGYYEFTIPVNSDSERTPTGYGASGLPAGLRIDTVRGVISGYPTVARATPYSVTLTASNARGKSTVVVPLQVFPLPAQVAGSYVGVLQRDVVLDQNLGGRINLAITSSGTFSGKLVLGPYTHSFSGALDTTLDGSPVMPTAVVRIVRPAPLPVLTLDLTVDAASNLITGSLSDGETLLPFDAYRQVWSTTLPCPAAYRGTHSFSLSITEDQQGVRTVPQGLSYGTLTVNSTGAYTITGKMADGEPISGSGFVSELGEVPHFQLLYSTTLKGSVVGVLEMVDVGVPEETSLGGTLTWSRPLNPLASARLYSSGFGPIELIAEGGRYIAPVVPELFMNLTPGPQNAILEFVEGGIHGSLMQPGITLGIGTGSTVILPATNPTTTGLIITPSTGAIRGSFVLTDANPANPTTRIVRTVTYTGQVVRTTEGYIAVGYFILPELPTPSQPNSLTTPQLSGAVLLYAAP